MDAFLSGFGDVFTVLTLFSIVVGTIVGVIAGVIPGLGSVIGITMVLPFTFSMPQVPAIALMLGVYCGSVYGGSITAIVLNTPGTPQAAATAIDGYPMALRGDADLAIGWVTAASTLGGLFSIIVLLVGGSYLAEFSLQFTPIEYFALGIFALICIVSVSRDALAKGLLSGTAGLLIATVGSDPINGVMRFTFGSFALSAGISLIPALVGLFAFGEMFVRVADSWSSSQKKNFRVGFKLPPISEWFKRWRILLRGCLIGSFVGALPGTGAATAAFISYSEAKRTSKNKENFGHGEPDGLIAPESANNAVTGSALVPTLALGIPGDPVTAVMLGALVIQGVAPGPQLFNQNMSLIYAIFISLFVINLVMFATGALGAQLFTRVLRIPEPLLVGLVLVIALVGAYGVRGNFLDIWIALAAGVVGAAMRFTGFPIVPMVIGIVLSDMIERSLRQGLLITHGNFWAFFERPIALTLFVLTVAMLTWSFITAKRDSRS